MTPTPNPDRRIGEEKPHRSGGRSDVNKETITTLHALLMKAPDAQYDSATGMHWAPIEGCNGDDHDLADYVLSVIAAGKVPGVAVENVEGRGPWTQEIPTEQAYYWHWDGDEDSAPLLWCVLKSGGDGKCFTSANQHGVSHSIDVRDWGGWWMRCRGPMTPKATP